MKRVDHLVPTTVDSGKRLDFYVGFLGMEADKAENRYALCFGEQEIDIHQCPGEFQPAAEHPAAGSADFCLVAEGDIKDIFAELSGKNAPFVPPDIVKRNGAMGEMDSVYLRDHDCNLVEISVYRH